jgi:NADH-quinone oxidoreductase subunit N
MSADFILTLPEIVLLVGACVLMLADLQVKDEGRALSYALAQLVLLACAGSTVFVLWGTGGELLYAFNGLYVADVMSHVLKLAAYGATSLALVYSRQYLLDRGLLRGEFLTLLLFSLLGMMVMISANNFLTIYLGLELMSLCLYAMVALDRDSATSIEAAMKYFVLGALSSGLLLYGMSMIYGATGSLSLTEVARQVATLSQDLTQKPFLIFGLVFVVCGVAFKVGVVPFHMPRSRWRCACS